MTSASNQAQKRFKCDECDYATNYKCNLKQHELNHTGEKPFECNFCEKKFSQSQTLENHRKAISHFDSGIRHPSPLLANFRGMS